jgi:hypothetical protein
VLDDLVQEAQDSLGPREREALWVRGMSDGQIDLYRVGYSETPLPLPGLGKVDDCWVFPLTNTLGQIRGVQVRPVIRSRKIYADYFAPGAEAEPVMYGLGQAMQSCWALGACCLVEGVFDLPPIQRAFEPTFATLKAGAPPGLIRVLRRLGIRVYTGWDNDKAGLKARSNLQKYAPDIKTWDLALPALPMPNGGRSKDPGDLWELWGTKKMTEFVTGITST